MRIAQQTPLIAALAVWSLGVIAIFVACFSLSGGHLVYTLDDPYIHLAVSETILKGGYGVNIGEASSPSSSVLYPFIIAITQAVGLREYGPFLVNLAATGLTVFLAVDFLNRHIFSANTGILFQTLLSIAVVLLLNAFALSFTGLEHPLHVLLVVVILHGLHTLGETGHAPKSLLAAIVLAPFIRFEGLAYSGGAILALVAAGRWKHGALCLAAIVAGFATYVGLMTANSLPPLPSSVTLKSALAGAAVDGASSDLLSKLIHRLDLTHLRSSALLLPLSIPVIIWAVRRQAKTWSIKRSPDWIIAIPTLIAITGHVLVGEYGWFSRYEVYVVALTSLTLLFLFRHDLRDFANERTRLKQVFVLFAAGYVGFGYLNAAWVTPSASAGIYRQQYQLHRLAADFVKAPVAVNDLGYVAYRNPAYVLDLWGLGSEPVRKARTSGTYDAATVDRLATDHGVKLAMIYTSWFPSQIPATWTRIGSLTTKAVTAAEGTVDFYAIDTADCPDLTARITAFAETVPDGVTVDVFPCPAQ